MSSFCSCKDWEDLRLNNSQIFKQDPIYGWVLHWIELSEERGYTQVHRYGVSINFCPMCGKQLKDT